MSESEYLSAPLHSPATPFYTGAVAAGDPVPAAVIFAGREYLIDLRQYRHNGLRSFRDGVVESNVPDDQLFNSEGAWWRYKTSFHHGAGQLVADLERDADPSRYYASRGIDPWTRYQACLLPSTELAHAATASTIYMTTTATHAYHSDGNAVHRSADLSSWSAITGMAAEAVTAMTTDGTAAYIATTNHLYVVNVGGVGASEVQGTPTAPDGDFSTIAFVANRLLVGDDNKLREVKDASLDTIFTHYQTAFRWTAIFQVGSRIYVGGFAGNRSELYSLTTTDDGSLVLSAEAASFFAGELLRGALSYGGSVILATSKGVRFAQVGGDGSLQYGPLIDAAGDCRCLAAEGRFAWFGWQNFPDEGCGVGRLALDTFVDTLQPAYATDVYTDDEDATVTALARFGNRTLFAVSSAGVYASSEAAYVTEGYLDTGELYFGTVEDKSITEVRVRTDLLGTGESVSIEMTNAETGDTLAEGTASTAGDAGILIDALGDIINHAALRITLAGDGTSTPCMRHWRARAFPVAPHTEEWIVPLIIHSSVVLGAGQGQLKSHDPWDEIQHLKNYWTSREVVTYQEGGHQFLVRIDNFEVIPYRWTDEGDWFEYTVKLRLLSV